MLVDSLLTKAGDATDKSSNNKVIATEEMDKFEKVQLVRRFDQKQIRMKKQNSFS